MDLKLSGKVVVVTGASKGIGLAVVRAFAEEGVDRPRVAAELAVELRATASWLDLPTVTVVGPGDLAGPLAAALA